MAFEFRLPDIGEGVVEGEIVKWHVRPGDDIKEDQPMVEVMTDKATVVIPSPKTGKVLETRGKEGDITQVDAVLVVIDEAGGSKAKAESKPPEPKRDSSPVPVKAEPAPLSEAPRPHPEAPTIRPGDPVVSTAKQHLEPIKAKSDRPVLAAPATRRLARELGVDISAIHGSGPGGRVTSEDVKRAVQSAPSAVPSAAPIAPNLDRKTMVPVRTVPVPALVGADDGLSERIPVRGIRGRIWDAMTVSTSTLAHFTFVEECDCENLVALRERLNSRLSEGEAKLQFLPFIVKAVIAALKRFPNLNGHVDDANREFIQRHDFNIGVAAATERGLLVPVIRNADRQSLIDLSREIKRLGEAARAGNIRPEDMGGSTFTITSLGKEGGIFATPIINYPEVAILGVHKMNKRAVVLDDDSIVARNMMNLSLSFDHRLIDGHVGAAFTYAVIKLLQEPDRLIMEMA
jgi:pyruvate dehydrogenase E2 component (dihydrolipoamide acetyltransferase)